TKIYLAAMSRANLRENDLKLLPNFYFYVDEFQSFVNDTFKDILSEARKYKLNLTIAHQYIEQMPEEVRDAVFGNVGTTIAFRVGPFDAEVLEKIFMPQFVAQDIVNLGFAQIYLTLMIDGVGSPPFSATTLGPIPPPTKSYRDEIMAHTRGTYARPVAVVEAEIKTWHEPIKIAPKERALVPPVQPRTPVVSSPPISPRPSLPPRLPIVRQNFKTPDLPKRVVPVPQVKQPQVVTERTPSNDLKLKDTGANKNSLRDALKDLMSKVPAKKPDAQTGTPSPQKVSLKIEESRKPIPKELPEEELRRLLEVK
ncbi:MAG: type IV secretory system conjugative DNA transfer family protein, partial [Patescibacteria group bacterium]